MVRPARKKAFTDLNSSINPSFNREPLSLLSAEGYATAFHRNPNSTVICSIPDGSYIEVNDAWVQNSGFKREEAIGRTALELNVWVSLEEREQVMTELRAKGRISNHEVRFRTKNGTIKICLFSADILSINQGTYMLSVFRDITLLKQTDEALRISENKFSRAFNISPIPLMITTLAEGLFVAVNEALCRVVGYTPEEILNRTSFELGIWNSRSSRQPVQDRISLQQPVREMDFFFRKKDGEERIGLLSAEAIEIDGEACILSTVQDITERRKAEIEIRYLSTHDPLTCLYNRAYFEEQLKSLDKAKQLPISIIIADVNGLKMVNDALGHEQGDLLLKSVADILAKSCRPIDIVARWGGDEFIILLTHCSHEAACLIMEQVKAACNSHHNLPAETSISLGMATMNHESQNIQNIIIEAEDKMFRRKLLENKSARSAFIISLEKTLWTRSHETREHCQRLEDMALAIGRGINLPNTELDNLKLLASLHDIGKIAVPNSILEKPGKLSQEEWETIRKHPEIGYRIAVSSPEMAPIAEAILHHHERWDGMGYPLGFKGEEIPLLSRIIAIADAYDVMVNGRPYQTPINPQKAWEEIERCSGTQFDPVLVVETLKLFVQTVGQV